MRLFADASNAATQAATAWQSLYSERKRWWRKLRERARRHLRTDHKTWWTNGGQVFSNGHLWVANFRSSHTDSASELAACDARQLDVLPKF